MPKTALTTGTLQEIGANTVRFILIFLILTFTSCFLYSSEKYFILDKSIVTIYDFEDKNIKKWNPSKSDVKEAEKIVLTFLKNSNEDTILNKYEKYYIQIAGLIIKGRKVLLFNFLNGDFSIEKLKSQYILVKDGGDDCFNVKIDLKKKECFDFRVNGIG